MACEDSSYAGIISRAVFDFDRNLLMVGLPHSELLRAARSAGLNTASEVFADRAYNDSGALVSRALPGSVIENEEYVIERILEMIEKSRVKTITGNYIDIKADTICVHGDTRNAVNLVIKIKEALLENGVEIKKLYEK